jgi:hypothetical protein|tara:strand:- start:491 stop:760 length:270 start_codon:yes stop_codon:yes gene_type:complete
MSKPYNTLNREIAKAVHKCAKQHSKKVVKDLTDVLVREVGETFQDGIQWTDTDTDAGKTIKRPQSRSAEAIKKIITREITKELNSIFNV